MSVKLIFTSTAGLSPSRNDKKFPVFIPIKEDALNVQNVAREYYLRILKCL